MPRVVYKPKIHYRVHKMPPEGLSWARWIQSTTLHPIFDIILIIILPCRSWGSSVSIVSDYRVDDRGTIPGRGKGFSSILCVQTGSEAQPASCTVGTGGSFPGGKARPGRDADHSPHLVPRSEMSRSYTSSSPCSLHGGSGTALLWLFFRLRLDLPRDLSLWEFPTEILCALLISSVRATCLAYLIIFYFVIISSAPSA
jgi:hypothetical protein